MQNTTDLHRKHLSQILLAFGVRELRLSFATTLLQKEHELQQDNIQVTEFLSLHCDLQNSPVRSQLQVIPFLLQTEHNNGHLYCFCDLAGR